MKKIIFTAALLGSAYFAQAQIAVGTPTPINSAYLDITASDKGILIPRVKLTSTTVFTPITGDQEESLLVYNTATAGTGNTAVKPGFYYWKNEISGTPAHWERVTDEAHLTEVIETLVEANLDNIKDLLEVAYPSNNIDGAPAGGEELGGGMVFTPGDSTATPAIEPKIEYVYHDGTSYMKKDITNDIANFIKGSESKTLLVKNAKYQYYVSETYLVANNGTAPVQGDVDTWTNTTFPTGVYYIDVVGGVVNNFEEIINSPVTIDNSTYNTIEEYIQNISESAMQNGVTKIVLDGTGPDAQASFYMWDEVAKDWKTLPVPNQAFKTIVRANETVTEIEKNSGTGAVGNEIIYTYTNEEEGADPVKIEITADVLNSITNNETIQNAITNIMNAGGNVYYGKINDTDTEEVFYTIDPVTKVKTPINLSNVVVNTITNLDNKQTNIVKNQLGDTITNNSSVFTGDTYVDGTTTYYVYKGEFTTTITANSALTSGVTLDKAGHKVLSIDIDYGKGLVSSVTDITLASAALGFNIGVGNTYTVLGTANITAKVIVTFASDVKPEGFL